MYLVFTFSVLWMSECSEIPSAYELHCLAFQGEGKRGRENWIGWWIEGGLAAEVLVTLLRKRLETASDSGSKTESLVGI